MAKKTKTKKTARLAAKRPKKAVTKKAKKTTKKKKPRATAAKKTAVKKSVLKPARKAKRKVPIPTVEQLVHSGEPQFVTPLDQV
jgi:hypothetical protein